MSMEIFFLKRHQVIVLAFFLKLQSALELQQLICLKMNVKEEEFF